MLKAYELGEEAIHYIKRELGDGDTLANYLLDLELEKGQVMTHLPNGVNLETILQFGTGGVVSKSYTTENLLVWIREYLDGGSNHLAIFETLARPEDPSLSIPGPPFLVHKNEVYYFVTSHSSESAISRSVRFARSYPFVGVLSSLPLEKYTIRTGQRIDKNTLRNLVQRCRYLLVGVYDNEAVLVWKRMADCQ